MLRITDHAVDRFRERIKPGLSFVEAKAQLQAACLRAAKTKERTPVGDCIWLVEEPPMRLVTHPGEKGDYDRGDVLVTVLPPAYSRLEELPLEVLEEELARAEEVIAAKEALPVAPFLPPKIPEAMEALTFAIDVLAAIGAGITPKPSKLQELEDIIGMVPAEQPLALRWKTLLLEKRRAAQATAQVLHISRPHALGLEIQLLQTDLSALKHAIKTVKHREKQEQEIVRLRSLLRSAICGLRNAINHPSHVRVEVNRAWEYLTQQDPYFVSDEFLEAR